MLRRARPRALGKIKVKQGLQLYLLGSWRLERDGEVLSLSTDKLRGLLAYLIFHPQPHRRGQLAELFWGDSTPERARASLRNALPLLRKIEPSLFKVDRSSVQWRSEAGLWVDALVFQTQAQQFLSAIQPDPSAFQHSLYRGELLTDLEDAWIVPLRSHFSVLYQNSMMHLVHRYQAAGEYERAVSSAHRLLLHEPTHEPAYQALMSSHLALGDTAAALRLYDQCRDVLQEELGVAPHPQTQALFHRICALSRKPMAPPTPSNLPMFLTRLIGRERELTAIAERFGQEEMRLLTLTGPGGCGKTRLGAAAAESQRPEFADGVWWIELTTVDNPAFLPHAIANSLGLREHAGGNLREQLFDFLRARQLLLVLDNCEHLVTSCAQLAVELLQACPRLKILATSREALGVTGEVRWRVPPLSLVSDSTTTMQSDAVRLFLARVKDADPTSQLPPLEQSLVTAICRTLDGLPLAIELVAALLQVLSLEQIAARLEEHFTLLHGSHRNAPVRHHTMHAAMEWGYQLLTPNEQVLLRALSVFRGGFSLDAAEAVAPSLGPMLLPTLSRLIDKSWLQSESHAGERRYHMLETSRHYGFSKLCQANEEQEIRERHLQWYTVLAERAESALVGPEQALWLGRLERESANLFAALLWAATQGEGAVECGLRLAGALWQFWWYHGHVAQAHAALLSLLAHPAALSFAKARAIALLTFGILEARRDHYGEAVAALEQSKALYQELGDTRRVAMAWHYMAWSATACGQFALAHQRHQEALTLQRSLGPAGLRDAAESLTYMGLLAYLERNDTLARSLHEEALAIKQITGETWTLGFSRWNLAQVALRQREYKEALAFFQEALRIAYALGGHWGLSQVLEGIGQVAQSQGQFERAATLFGAAQAVRQQTHESSPPILAAQRQSAIAAIQASLGESRFREAWSLGEQISLADAVDLAMQPFLP